MNYYVTISVDNITIEQIDDILAFLITQRGSLEDVSVSYSKALSE